MKVCCLSYFDLNLSTSIFGHKQFLRIENKDELLSKNSKNKSKIQLIHFLVISLFRIVIDFKNIKLAKQVNEELIEVPNSNATEKKNIIRKIN